MSRATGRAVRRPGVARADLSETDWQKVLVNFMEEQGWIVNHIGRARTASGDWVTPTTSSGWPDLLAVRGPRLLAVEVKDRRKPIDEAQIAWLAAFSMNPATNAWCLRPTMSWEEIGAWISHPETAPVTFGFDPTKIPGDPVAWLLARKHEGRRSKPSQRGSHGGLLDTPSTGEQGQML